MLKAAVGALGAPARPPRGEAVDRGAARDRAEVARRLGLTRARLTQLMDLTLLAPDIQERVLQLQAIDGEKPMSERELRAATSLIGRKPLRSALLTTDRPKS